MNMRAAASGGADEVIDVGRAQNGGAGGVFVEADAIYATTRDTGINAVIRYDRALRIKERLEGGCSRFGGGVVRHPVTRDIVFGCHESQYVFRAGVAMSGGIQHDLGMGRGVYSIAVRNNELFVATGGMGIARIDATTGAVVNLTSTTAYGVTATATHLYWVDGSQFVWAMRL